MRMITMGSDEFILYIRKQHPNCQTFRRAGFYRRAGFLAEASGKPISIPALYYYKESLQAKRLSR